jgi:hypothetical protein
MPAELRKNSARRSTYNLPHDSRLSACHSRL